MNDLRSADHEAVPLTRYAARGAAIGFLGGLALCGSKAMFGMLEEKQLLIVPICAFVGSAIGLMLWQHRDRDCPRCGVSMGKAHGLPSRAPSGGTYYYCPRCQIAYPAIPMANAELARPRAPLDPELDS